VELEYLSKAGKLIDADAAINAQVEMAVRVRTRVLGVTSRVRQRCPDAARAILTAIDEELRLALEEVADGAKGAAA
jgi:phage terminase Nu1 subunit (DNA packaging protein)